MTTDLERIRQIFLATIEQPPAQWDALLDEACGNDADLRRQVAALVQAHAKGEGILDRNPAGQAQTGAFEPVDQRPGTVIGPYKLLQQIGEGGMGTVFMAEQTRPVQRKVALKVIKPGMDSRQVIARFEAERQALAMMDHVNIARVLDAGATDTGRPYFVMELVHGVPITKYCDDNHLTPRERLELFVPVCQAIQHAHQKGIIHRDIKPSNVMITLYDGKPVAKVIDFGVSKATEQKLTERTLFTQYGTMIGTLEYMSPEQAEMSALGVDTRSDIYSLGVLLYELLTGGTPLRRKQIKEAALGEILRLIREEEAPKPSTRLSDSGEALASISAQRRTEPAKLSKLMRGELDWIVLKALEKDRNRRYETASGFGADLQRYLADEPVLACPPSAGYRARKFARRHKAALIVAGLAGCVMFLLLVTGLGLFVNAALREDRDLALSNQQRAETAEHRALDAEHEIKIRAHLARALAIRRSGQIGQRTETLAEVAEALALHPSAALCLELRNAAIASLALPDLSLSKQRLGWPAGSSQVDFDGKLEHYVRVDRQGAGSIRRVDNDKEIASIPGSGAETWPQFSRDGKFLVLWSVAGMNVWKLGGRKPVEVLKFPAGINYAIDFSPDHRQVAVGQVDGSIILFDLVAGKSLTSLPGGVAAAGLAFNPAGSQLAVSHGDSVEIRDLATGKAVMVLKSPVPISSLAWNPDGKTLAVGGNDPATSRIDLWDVAAGKQTLALEGLRNGGIRIAFNHAGDMLASVGWEGMLRLWDARTGKLLFGTASGAGVPRFSPDDRLLSADLRDRKIALWEITSCREYRTLLRAAADDKGIYEYSTIRSDGRVLAVAMHNCGVGLWDLPGGAEMAFLPVPGCDFALFEPSGALLTNGSAGLLRWPVQGDPAAPGLLRVGPPHQLPVPGPICHVACSSNGRVIAVSQFQSGRVLHADRPNQPVSLGRHDDARDIAVSPDGRWVATASFTRTGVKIWDARDGRFVKELPIDSTLVGFSPDGKRLATTGGGLRLWTVGSWQERIEIGGNRFAFSPDSKLLAVGDGIGPVRLLDPETGTEYARLEDPNRDRTWHMSFSPDGTRLVATNNDSRSIHVWDLRMIRERLAKLGLDWDLPPYAPAAETDKPLRVEVDPGNLAAMIQVRVFRRQADGYLRSKQWEKAIAEYSKALELDPKCASAQNAQAWLLATCSDASFRDPTRAVELATKAFELTPLEGNAWNTLGVAHYRAGDWKAAVAELARSNELLGGEELSFNAFFLAMAEWQLGHKGEARMWHDRAVQWMKKNQPKNEELGRFLVEAEGLLKIEKEAGPK